MTCDEQDILRYLTQVHFPDSEVAPGIMQEQDLYHAERRADWQTVS